MSLHPRSGAPPLAPARPVVYLSDGPLPTRCGLCRSRLVLEADTLRCLLHERVAVEVVAERPRPFAWDEEPAPAPEPTATEPAAPRRCANASACGNPARPGARLPLCTACFARHCAARDRTRRGARPAPRTARPCVEGCGRSVVIAAHGRCRGCQQRHRRRQLAAERPAKPRPPCEVCGHETLPGRSGRYCRDHLRAHETRQRALREGRIQGTELREGAA